MNEILIKIEPFPRLLDSYGTILAYIVGICAAVAVIAIISIKVFRQIERPPEL